ncbi:MAG: serine hydrolase domain-containing protein, partial [Woeseiaceae bacterium]
MIDDFAVFPKTLATLALFLSLAFDLPAEEREFQQLGEIIEREVANKNLPMLSIILVDEDGVAWRYGTGTDANNPDRVADSETTYRIGSVSKLFTDIVVMQMVEKGILDLDEPVTAYLPDFKPQNDFDEPITLRLLMSHSSGLIREPPIGNYFDASAPTLTETVASLNRTGLVYKPGSKVQYSNAGIAVVGRILEKVSGISFARLLEENALRPLGMTRSAFTPEEHLLANLPEAYMWRYQGDRTVAPTFELGMQPAGSMFSTMDDLALFMSALIKKGAGLNDRILSEATLEQMWTPQSDIRSGRNRSFGIGFSLGRFADEMSVSHGGAIYGFATQLKVLPASKLGVAVSTNLDMANGAINRITDYALRVLLAEQAGQAMPEFHVSNTVTDAQAEQLLGLYENEEATIRVTRRFEDLYIERIQGLSLRLRQAGGHIVIDDIMTYSDDIEFVDNKIRVFGDEYVRAGNEKPAESNPDWAGLLGE